MSQLNPNAAEFVPVSPTRSIPSPACRLINDPVIAQSPKRPSEIDINLPDPQDFEKEVKSRPSDVDPFSNGHNHEGDQKSPSQELMENLLNGKNIDEIPEFLPGTTPTKNAASEEFHFGPNAAPFTPIKTLDQSEAALSTKAVCGDESTDDLDSTIEVSTDNIDFAIRHKEDDPMSMSFYQDKDSGDVDPFDLNKVQLLPENLDDFLSKSDQRNVPQEDSISDLPQHEPSKDLLSDEIILNNDERIQTTDLDKVDEEKELASPVSNDDDSSGICELSKSPQPQTDDLMCRLECSLPKEALPDVCLRPESKSPLMAPSPDLEIVSPEPTAMSPIPAALSPEPLAPAVLTPEPIPQTLSPEPVPQTLSPEPQPLSPSPELCLLDSKPEPVMSPEPETQLSPEPPAIQTLSPEPQGDVCQIPKSIGLETEIDVCTFLRSKHTPEPEQLVDVAVVEDLCNLGVERRELSVDSPIEDVTSSVKDVSSPILSPVPDQFVLDPIQLNFAQEISNAVESSVTIEKSSPIRDDVLPEVCPLSTPRSTADSVATADVNSFLGRSPLADLESPLSPGDTTITTSHPLSKCVYPLPTEIETENIAPEFAESVVLSPTETKDDTPSVPSQEETVKEAEIEKREETVPVVAVAAAAAAVAGVAAAAAVTTEKKSAKIKAAAPGAKKPLPKTTAATTASRLTPSATKTKTTPLTARAKPSPAARTTAAPKAATATAPKPAVPKLAPKPRTGTPATTRASTEKKPLANGDVKAPARTSLGRKPTEAARPLPAKPATTRLSSTASRPPAPRPATAPAARPITKTAATTAAPKPRPATLGAKPLPFSTASKTASSTTTTSRLLSSARPAAGTTASKTAAPPKPRPATAPAKPKVPATRTVTKTSTDTEKQIKDSANKLTASRTLTSSRTSTTTAARTSTTRKTEAKVSGTTTRTTTVTKTSMNSTLGSAGKKPQEIVRNANKTTKTTKIEKPVQNGVATQVVTEQITIVNNAVSDRESQLLKDNSPIDNKLLGDTNA